MFCGKAQMTMEPKANNAQNMLASHASSVTLRSSFPAFQNF